MNSPILIKKVLSVCVFFVALLSTGVAQAQSVAELEQQVVSLRDHVKEAEQELQALKQELADIKQEEPAVQREYQKVSDELEQAFAKANSEDAEAHKDAMVVSFKFNRVDRKYTRFMERKQEVEDSVAGMTAKVAEWKAELAATEKALVDARAAAQLASQQAAEQARLDAAAKAAADRKKAEQAAAAAATAVVVKEAPKKAPNLKAAGWPKSKSPTADQIAFAKQEVARLEALPASRAPFDKVELEPACGDDVDLQYLGDGIYSAVTELSGGMCKMEVFRSDYWMDLPATGEAQYRVIYDVSSISSPKLFVFEERLLRE